MTALSKYISKKNQMRALFDQKLWSIPTSFDECKPIFVSIAFELSPENMHRDGEATSVEVAQKLEMLTKAWRELERISKRQVTEEDAWSFTN